MTKSKNVGREATQFKPGNKTAAVRTGSRNKLTSAFLAELSEHFEKEGKDAIKRLCAKDPGRYLSIIASLAPKELHIANDNPFADVGYDLLVALIAEAERLVAAGGEDGAGEAQGGVEPTPLH